MRATYWTRRNVSLTSPDHKKLKSPSLHHVVLFKKQLLSMNTSALIEKNSYVLFSNMTG